MLPAPDAEEARRLLQDELAKSAYVEAQPNIVERILGDLLRSIVDLLDGMRGLGAGPGTLVLAVGAALVVVVAVLLVRPRLNARGGRTFDRIRGAVGSITTRRAPDHAHPGVGWR